MIGLYDMLDYLQYEIMPYIITNTDTFIKIIIVSICVYNIIAVLRYCYVFITYCITQFLNWSWWYYKHTEITLWDDSTEEESDEKTEEETDESSSENEIDINKEHDAVHFAYLFKTIYKHNLKSLSNYTTKEELNCIPVVLHNERWLSNTDRYTYAVILTAVNKCIRNGDYTVEYFIKNLNELHYYTIHELTGNIEITKKEFIDFVINRFNLGVINCYTNES